jgi:multidrug efflux pump subunit AcrA (membrane-fusion protein)
MNSVLARLALPTFLLLLAGCSQQVTPTPTPVATALPPVALVRTGGSAITASANVVPAQGADLAFAAAGQVATVAVAAGVLAPAGTLLLALEDGDAQDALAQAQAAYFRAQALQAQVLAKPTDPALAAAQAQLDAAQARFNQLAEGVRPAEIKAAEAELYAAQAAYQQLFAGPDAAALIVARAALFNARAAVQQAQSAYDRVKWSADIGALPESRLLQQATTNLEAAQATYDGLFVEPDASTLAAAQARIQQVAAALDRLQAPATAAQLAEAQAQVYAAQAQQDALIAGAGNEAIAVAAGAVAEARAAMVRAENQLARYQLRAPFTGTVTTVSVAPGEMVQPGAPVLTLADLAHLQVETTDLSERDVVFVRIGQVARVLIEPLDQTIAGRVVSVAPQASRIGGDVVYTVRIDLDEQLPALRWGMSAEVEILPEE